MRQGPSGKMFDEQWREIPDDTPVSVPVNLRPKSMEQMVAMYVQQAMALDSRMKGEENSEEAEDMEVDDEGDSEILTPYELHALAADAEREARRRLWLRQQMAGRKKPAAEPPAKEASSTEPPPGQSPGPTSRPPEPSADRSLQTPSSQARVQESQGR